MTKDPWTDPDPQPGDLDADLASLDPRYVKHHKGKPQRQAENPGQRRARRRRAAQRIALARSRKSGDVVAELIRDAPHRAAE